MIGIALSMDALSLTISLGTQILKVYHQRLMIILIGLFHFLFPLIGNYFGIIFIKRLLIINHYLLVIIFLFLAIEMLISYIKPEKPLIIKTNRFLILSFSVSLDSFSVGLGLSNFTDNFLLAAFTFSIISSSFTTIGFIIGNYVAKNFGQKTNLLGATILFILAIIYFFR